MPDRLDTDSLRPRFEMVVNRYGATLGTRPSSQARRLNIIETRSASTVDRAIKVAGELAREHNMIIRYQLARRANGMTYYPCVRARKAPQR
ncbi:hypothetical protein [Streptomyces luteolus]|uniref:Uncharacterized protein n=1 Tax=Streptomyces luteolus TaxID=3043615 RepID=A0ABT6T6U7_9ACTN|nr:hypothetical protein [Streptomyces sp. B-S-A12]MDI3423611.1 hypothetical protein [Streptomyces sp. B-S-A12]